MITISVENIIKFYDEQDRKISNHVSSITGIIGEDLGAGLIKHFFDLSNRECTIYNKNPTEGSKKGKWLDRWIKVKNSIENNYTFYQTEIKNWSSYSKGGKKIELNANLENLMYFAKARFNELWNHDDNTLIKDKSVAKVLKKMKEPSNISDNDIIKPLICFWYPIYNQSNMNNIEALFEINCNDFNFNQITFFSMSLYLRKLLEDNVTEIQIESPNIKSRVNLINNLLKC